MRRLPPKYKIIFLTNQARSFFQLFVIPSSEEIINKFWLYKHVLKAYHQQKWTRHMKINRVNSNSSWLPISRGCVRKWLCSEQFIKNVFVDELVIKTSRAPPVTDYCKAHGLLPLTRNINDCSSISPNCTATDILQCYMTHRWRLANVISSNSVSYPSKHCRPRQLLHISYLPHPGNKVENGIRVVKIVYQKAIGNFVPAKWRHH